MSAGAVNCAAQKRVSLPAPSSPAEVFYRCIQNLHTLNENLSTMRTSDVNTNQSELILALKTLKYVQEELSNVHSELKHDGKCDIKSNFGVSLKVDLAKSNLQKANEKLNNMRREWYLQEEHISKIINQVKDSQQEIDFQCVYEIQQSLILSRMLWNASKFNEAVENWVTSRGNCIEKVMTVVDSCIYALLKAGEINTLSDEYNLVMALCGTVSNISSIPDGRHYIISSRESQRVYNMMIKAISRMSAPETNDLKWIMLVCIHNMLINVRCLEFIKQNEKLIECLAICITPPHSKRVTGIALHIIRTLTEENLDSTYAYMLVKILPMQLIEHYCSSKKYYYLEEDCRVILDKLLEIYEMFKVKAEQFSVVECSCPFPTVSDTNKRRRNKKRYADSVTNTEFTNDTANMTCEVSTAMSKTNNSILDTKTTDNMLSSNKETTNIEITETKVDEEQLETDSEYHNSPEELIMSVETDKIDDTFADVNNSKLDLIKKDDDAPTGVEMGDDTLECVEDHDSQTNSKSDLKAENENMSSGLDALADTCEDVQDDNEDTQNYGSVTIETDSSNQAANKDLSSDNQVPIDAPKDNEEAADDGSDLPTKDNLQGQSLTQVSEVVEEIIEAVVGDEKILVEEQQSTEIFSNVCTCEECIYT